MEAITAASLHCVNAATDSEPGKQTKQVADELLLIVSF